MKIKILLVAMLLSSGAVSAQKLQAIEQTIDLSNVAFRQPVTAVFRLKNVSDTPIRITDVTTDCGCTTVEYPHTVVDRGNTVVIKAVFDARQMGHFEKTIDVYTGKDDRPCVLSIKGVVREPSLVSVNKPVIRQESENKVRAKLPLMQLSPRQIVFRYTGHSRQRSTLMIKNAGSAPLVIKEIVLVNHDGLKLSVGSKRIKQGKAGKISVRMSPADIDVHEKSRIVITTNDPDNSEVTIPIIIEKVNATDRNR